MKRIFSFAALVLSVMALTCVALAAEAPSGVPEEFVGEWAGSVDNINLSFDIGEDGQGTYTFEQSGYHESYDFSLSVESESFSVQIPANNRLGIASIDGTYAYADGILTLQVQTMFANGRVFAYTVPCQRALQSVAFEPTEVPEEYIGKWAGTSGNISLIFEIGADSRATFTFKQGNYTGSNDVALSVADETFTVEVPENDELGSVACGGTYAYNDGILTLNIENTFVTGRVFAYTVHCERMD